MRINEGNLVYAESRRLEDGSNLVVEVTTLRLDLEFCINQNYLPLIMETDSLSVQKIIDGAWKLLWAIALEVGRINILMERVDVKVEHTFREANKLADFFANLIFCFAGTQRLTYTPMQDIQREAKAIITMDRDQIPNLRIQNHQNREFKSNEEHEQ